MPEQLISVVSDTTLITIEDWRANVEDPRPFCANPACANRVAVDAPTAPLCPTCEAAGIGPCLLCGSARVMDRDGICGSCAREEDRQQAPIDVVVFVEGGIVRWAATDNQRVRVIVVDRDEDGAQEYEVCEAEICRASDITPEIQTEIDAFEQVQREWERRAGINTTQEENPTNV